jgi:hypothetical protein
MKAFSSSFMKLFVVLEAFLSKSNPHLSRFLSNLYWNYIYFIALLWLDSYNIIIMGNVPGNVTSV